jgi:hypothetical protein
MLSPHPPHPTRRPQGASPTLSLLFGLGHAALPFLLEACLLDATGVLIGQSGGMKKERSSKSRTGGSGATRPLGTAKVEVSESGDDPRSYPLTEVSKPRFITHMRVNTMVVGPVAIPSLSRGRRRFILRGRLESKSAVHRGDCRSQDHRRCIEGIAYLRIIVGYYGSWKGRISDCLWRLPNYCQVAYVSPERCLHPAEHSLLWGVTMIQWVASPLNQRYSLLTGMTGEGETEEERMSGMAKGVEDGTNLGASTTHSLKIVH